MNDALDHGEHMRAETVTMSRDEYEAAIRAAKVEVLRELAASHLCSRDPETDTDIFDPWDVAEMLRARADELEGEG